MKILYNIKQGKNPKKPFYRLVDRTTHQDLRYILEKLLEIPQCDNINDAYKVWFKKPNLNLGRQPRQNNEYNSPESTIVGMLDKLNQGKNQDDPTSVQCQMIERLFDMLVNEWQFNIAKIEFVDQSKTPINLSRSQGTFNKLFG